MTSSRAKDRSAWALALSVLLLSGAVQAQTLNAPTSLDPTPAESAAPEGGTAQQQPVAAPRRLVAPEGAQDAAKESMPQQVPAARMSRPTAAQSTKSGIEVEGVGAIDSESVGAYARRDGGLGAEMWRGVSRKAAVDYVNAIPSQTGYMALRDVAARLLLSRATVPISASDDAPSLLAARAKALLRLGDVEGARLMLSVSPSQGRPVELDAVDAMLSLLSFNNARACGLARNNQARALDDFWQRALVYCDALDKKSESVNLGLSLLREVGDDDQATALLTDSLLTGNAVTLETIKDPKPIHLVLSRAANSPLPVDIVKSDDPLVLHGAALAPNLVLGSRIEAAERAVAMGALNPLELRQLYAEVPYSDADRQNALSRAKDIGGAAARALLYQAAANQNIPTARAEIIATAFDVAREDDRFLPAVMAFRPLIDRLPPSPEMVWFALRGVRAFLTLGDPVGTNRWLALLRASAQVRDENKRALDRIAPLARLIGAGDRREDVAQLLLAWENSLDDTPETVSRRELLNGLLLALGEPVPIEAWDGIPSVGMYPQNLPALSVWFRLRQSMQAMVAEPRTQMGAMGTAGLGQVTSVAMSKAESDIPPGVAVPAILVLQAMGAGGPGTQGLAVVFEAVTALKTLGLDGAARRLAVETALAAGL
jgi:hypothetical protein